MPKSVVLFVILMRYTSFAEEFAELSDYEERNGLRSDKALRTSLDMSFFPSLENYQVDAKSASEKSYPWMGRVVHSPVNDYPHMCTAVCIEERIFITAARCLYSLKVNYTGVIYLNYHFMANAIVVPSAPSKQSFDDIGFLIVDTHQPMTRSWATIDIFENSGRPDNDFHWFEHLKLDEGPIHHRAVGYAVKKFAHRLKNPFTKYHLSTLDVVVGRNMCAEMFTFNRIQAFYVPCYHSCNLRQHRLAAAPNAPPEAKAPCKSYLGVEGAALYNFKTNKLLGIATWGAYFYGYELPVGFAVPNSVNFGRDLDCARKIRDDPSIVIVTGYYQALCNDMSFRYK